MLPSILSSMGKLATDPAALGKLIAQVGVSSVVLLFLVWSIIGEMRGEIREMRIEHQSLMFYSRGTCLNTAPDESTARVRCLLPSER